MWRDLEVSEESRAQKVLLLLELRDFFADGRLAACHSLSQRLLQSADDPLDTFDLKARTPKFAYGATLEWNDSPE